MKKSLFLSLVLALSFSLSAMAQPRTIGVNLGYGVDLSYQHTLSRNNMIDLNISLPCFLGIGAEATYDWLNPFNTKIPWKYKGRWDWEMGAGAGAGVYFPPFLCGYAGAAGHIGVSYDFWFPLQLSLDWRPVLGVEFGERGDNAPVGFYSRGFYGITLGVRYRF